MTAQILTVFVYGMITALTTGLGALISLTIAGGPPKALRSPDRDYFPSFRPALSPPCRLDMSQHFLS
jgi:hypothetical protein